MNPLLAQWVRTNGPSGGAVNCLAVSPNGAGGTNLLAGTFGGGIFLTSNNGTSWTAVNGGLTNTVVWSLAPDLSGNLFAGTNSGIFLSTNNGTSWTAVNSGLTNTVVFALAVSGTNLFAGTSGDVSRLSLAEMITSVPEIADGEFPKSFHLEHNYPDPFNPSTIIEFSLPRTAHVTLKLFNTAGEEIATLVSEELATGTYATQWNAGPIASGVYFYRIQVGLFTETKKLVVLK